ncbi:hypothetical protein [Vagococcus salmoninarum]|uniref:hypothetical protein n=1 Tax=Vagococcus salmoninarum TaxID=2739 RepID=UPI003F9E27FC
MKNNQLLKKGYWISVILLAVILLLASFILKQPLLAVLGLGLSLIAKKQSYELLFKNYDLNIAAKRQSILKKRGNINE